MASVPVGKERPRGRHLLVIGLVLGVLGVLTYAAQLSMQRLWTPWYLPVSATLGVLLIVLSLWRARTAWRVLTLVLLVLLAAAEWALLAGARLPEYAGPVAAGASFPAFTTARADGTAFTRGDLAGDQNSVLVFFRGRW
jgi:hypothetical protein